MVTSAGLSFAAAACALGCALDARNVSFVADAGAGPASAGGGGEGGASNGDCRQAGAPIGPQGCATREKAQELITDFSDATPVLDDECNPGIAFEGTVGNGQSFVYSAFGLEPPSLSLVEDGHDRALRYTASPGTPVGESFVFLGFGLGWAALELDCTDASAFRGIRFTMAGSVGTCQLFVGMQISENVQAQLNPAGTCELENGCAPPSSEVADPSSGVISIPFSEMHYGNPVDGVDSTSIIGVNWGLRAPLEGPPCEVDVVVDDVGFFE